MTGLSTFQLVVLLLASPGLSGPAPSHVAPAAPDPAPAVTLISGTISDNSSTRPITGRVIFGDLRTGDTLMTSKVNAATGQYRAILEPGKDYGIGVITAGYLYASSSIAIPENATYSEPTIDFPLPALKKGAVAHLRNTVFAEGSADLLNPAMMELRMLAAYLEVNPSVKLEIGAYSGKTGKEKNKKLAGNRATAIKTFMEKSLGAASGRVTTKGYSGKQTGTTNKVEIKVTAL